MPVPEEIYWNAGGDTVERLKIYGACAVFLLLTAVKLLFPDYAATVRAQVHSIMSATTILRFKPAIVFMLVT